MAHGGCHRTCIFELDDRRSAGKSPPFQVRLPGVLALASVTRPDPREAP